MSALEILGDVAEFLEDYSDVVDGDDGAPAPNKAMSLLGEVEREIERLKAQPNKVVCPFCNPILNPGAHAAEPMVPNGEYREILLGGSSKPQPSVSGDKHG